MTTINVLHKDAAGIPIIMIHGVGDSVASWQGVAELLGDEHPLVMYTLRGHELDGSNPAPPYEMADFVGDVISIMDAQGFDRAILAGFSLGGLIAQAVTLAHPDRVVALITVGSVAGRTAEDVANVTARYNEVRETGPYAVAVKSVDRWFSPDYLAAHPEAREQTLAKMKALDPECYAAAYKILATSDFADELATITVPVLAIAGVGDVGSPPRMSQRIADSVANGTCVVIPNVKHQLLQETPELVAKEVERFVHTLAS